MSTSAAKRQRVEGPDADLKRLAELVDLKYDRDAIDELVEMYVQTSKGAGAASSAAAASNELICCPRSYEESFLHEPIGTQRPCARDGACEGLAVHGTDGFVLREFLYPGEKPLQTRQLCLLCRRHEISTAYYRYETGEKLKDQSVRISKHYNLVGVPGEYDVRDCIVSGSDYSGLVLPVVLHIRSAYTCHMKDGVRHLVQSRMRCPGQSDPSEPGGFLGRRAGLTAHPARSDPRLGVKSS